MVLESIRVACPLVTPFDDGTVDHEALASLVEHLADAGVDGFVPCGTTGEFASLTPEERRAVVETTVETAPGNAPIVAGAADTAIGSVRDRIREVADAGADAALVPPPYYYTASDPADNRRFFEAVADGSPLPLYLYNIPTVVHEEIAPETVASLADHDRIVGTKDSGGDLTHVIDVLGRVPGDFQVLQGHDGQLVPGIYMGMDGGVNALSHVVPDVLLSAVEAVRVGDHGRARRLQRDTIGPLFGLGAEYGFAAATKVSLANLGRLDAPAVRPPLELPDADGRSVIESTVDDVIDGI